MNNVKAALPDGTTVDIPKAYWVSLPVALPHPEVGPLVVFRHSPLTGKSWQVLHYRTGLRIATGQTRKYAVEAAMAVFERKSNAEFVAAFSGRQTINTF